MKPRTPGPSAPPATRPAALRAFGLGLLLGLAGCMQKVTVISDPAGAEVRLGRALVGTTPTVVEVRNLPFSENVLKVRANNQRTVEIKVKRFRLKSQYEAVFVRKHGRAGTWTVEEAEAQ
jgi:hypothetical protein